MCILSVFSPGATVVPEHLENGACHNPDGHGFAVSTGTEIVIGKGMEPGAVLEAFCRVRAQHPDTWALFHSRITTDGLTDESNCHPFTVAGTRRRTVLAHNGILPESARPRGKDTRSDTRILAEDLIPRGTFGELHRPRAQRSLERWATRNYTNKIAILTVDPRFKRPCVILGENYGTWVEGVWHSNGDYRRPGPSSAMLRAEESIWRAWRKGEITHAQYDRAIADLWGDSLVDTIPPGEDTSAMVRCTVCASDTGGEPRYQVVNEYGVCDWCGACGDCKQYRELCQCYIPMALVRRATGGSK